MIRDWLRVLDLLLLATGVLFLDPSPENTFRDDPCVVSRAGLPAGTHCPCCSSSCPVVFVFWSPWSTSPFWPSPSASVIVCGVEGVDDFANVVADAFINE